MRSFAGIVWYKYVLGGTDNAPIPTGVSTRQAHFDSDLGGISDGIIVQAQIPVSVSIAIDGQVDTDMCWTSLLPTATEAGPLDKYYAIDRLNFKIVKVTINNTSGSEADGNVSISFVTKRAV